VGLVWLELRCFGCIFTACAAAAANAANAADGAAQQARNPDTSPSPLHCPLHHSLVQGVAAAQAGVSVIQPNVGRTRDWYNQHPGVIRDPHVSLVVVSAAAAAALLLLWLLLQQEAGRSRSRSRQAAGAWKQSLSIPTCNHHHAHCNNNTNRAPVRTAALPAAWTPGCSWCGASTATSRRATPRPRSWPPGSAPRTVSHLPHAGLHGGWHAAVLHGCMAVATTAWLHGVMPACTCPPCDPPRCRMAPCTPHAAPHAPYHPRTDALALAGCDYLVLSTRVMAELERAPTLQVRRRAASSALVLQCLHMRHAQPYKTTDPRARCSPPRFQPLPPPQTQPRATTPASAPPAPTPTAA